MQIQTLEQLLSESKSKITALKQANAEQKQNLEDLQGQLRSRAQDDHRIEHLQQQLSQVYSECQHDMLHEHMAHGQEQHVMHLARQACATVYL